MPSETVCGAGVFRPLRTGREADDVRRFSHEAMATVYEVNVSHPDHQYAAQAAQAE